MAGMDGTAGFRKTLASGSQGRNHRLMYTAVEVSNMKTKWTVLIQVLERRPVETSRSVNPTVYRNYWLTDMTGTKVPAIVFGDDVYFFERSLLPYNRYYISNASVRPTKAEYQVGEYRYTWYLNSSTPIQPIVDDVPMNLPCAFDLTPFAEFGRDADRETDITVKALVLKGFPIKFVRPGLWSRDYVLVNNEKKPVILKTWKYGPEPVSIELQHSLQDPPLLVVENVKVTTFNGISLSTKHTAMFLQDPPISEDVPLKQWYKDNAGEIMELVNTRKYRDPTMFLETPQLADLIPIQMAVNSIDTLKTCWVAGKISLILGQRSFWFASCSNCNRNMNAEEGWEQWCVSCEENMVVKYRYHFDVLLSDEFGALPADLYTPDAEFLLGCDAVHLEQQNMPRPLLEATIKAAVDDKHVVCFIKVYDRLVRGVNMRTFPIVRLYAYEDLYPSNKVIPPEDNAGSSSIALDDIASDCSLKKLKDVPGEFFTPSTKKILEELTQETVLPSGQDQATSLKRSLFPNNATGPGASTPVLNTSTVAVEEKEAEPSIAATEVTSPVKKNKNKEKTT